ncbi:MAG: site-specific integrase [Lachnospiraceae bacterium]|nr:site-specific integrase [Lachnospiraceae bacterium]
MSRNNNVRKDKKGRILPTNVRQRENGLYEGRITFNGKRYTLYNRDLATLKKQMTDRKYELEHGIYGDHSDVTVAEWYEEWMKTYKRPVLKYKTMKSYESRWNAHIAGKLGGLQISEVDKMTMQKYFSSLADTVSPLVYTSVSGMLHEMFGVAVENDLISKNPVILKPVDWKRYRANPKVPLTKEEVNIFLSYVHDNPYYSPLYPLFVVAFGTGMRVGEYCALQCDDIDFDSNLIRVNKTLIYPADYAPCRVDITDPKTASSVRFVPMLPEVRKAIEQQIKVLNICQRKVKIPINGFDDFLFLGNRGLPMNGAQVNRMIGLIVEDYNRNEEYKARKEQREPILLKNFSPHIMRHTFASRCAESGMEPKVVQEILGHTSVQTTLNVYTHLTQQYLGEKLLEKADFLF